MLFKENLNINKIYSLHPLNMLQAIENEVEESRRRKVQLELRDDRKMGLYA